MNSIKFGQRDGFHSFDHRRMRIQGLENSSVRAIYVFQCAPSHRKDIKSKWYLMKREYFRRFVGDMRYHRTYINYYNEIRQKAYLLKVESANFEKHSRYGRTAKIFCSNGKAWKIYFTRYPFNDLQFRTTEFD